ncbi:2368_t:CDS:2 [Cetraspora pellucida]|uniref:2368_t:CDS:1 n=1 Tax=Cetraspora pellucida TaxID=1433469 RepID=A0ACA9KD86_9GLOM|nr:2368_t:CDS:2 [Cetraspora pellucida]
MTNTQYQYCKICIKQLEGTCTQPYPYTKSGGSTEHLTYHLRDKHQIIANNYREHLDSYHENLESKVCMIITDNGSNMVKGIELLKDNCIASVFQQPCAVHTLQLSVREGLKQGKSVHQCLKNIQAFFHFPKQVQQLQKAQINIDSANLSQETDENETISPLEILTDCKTYWNSAYLAWKRILELYPVMRTLAVSLQINSDATSKKKADVIDLLKPFEEITKLFCGAKYPTINLIYPYVVMLKNKYAPVAENGEYIEDWITLIYGSLSESSKTSNSTSTSSGDKASIPSAGNRKQWQYAHHNMHAEYDDSNTVKYVSPTSCEGLLEKMRAAIYLSFDELWSIPNKVGLKASMLDPYALKLLPFATADEQKNIKEQIREELSILKAQSSQNNNITETSTIEEEECD